MCFGENRRGRAAEEGGVSENCLADVILLRVEGVRMKDERVRMKE